MDRPLFVSVLGWSGSGKTTLVLRALEECRRRGIPAAAAKRAHHEPDLAPAGKDSTAFLEAGALASLYIGDKGAALFMPSPAEPDRAFYEGLFPGASVVFLEGARVEGAYVAETSRGAAAEGELKRPLKEIDLLVTDSPSLAEAARAAGTAVLGPDDPTKLIDILEAKRGTRG